MLDIKLILRNLTAKVVELTLQGVQECYYSLNGDSKLGGALSLLDVGSHAINKQDLVAHLQKPRELRVRLLSDKLEVIGTAIIGNVTLERMPHRSASPWLVIAPSFRCLATSQVNVKIQCLNATNEGPPVTVAYMLLRVSLVEISSESPRSVPDPNCAMIAHDESYSVPQRKAIDSSVETVNTKAEESDSSDSVDSFVERFKQRLSAQKPPTEPSQPQQESAVKSKKKKKQKITRLEFKESSDRDLLYSSAQTDFGEFRSDQRGADLYVGKQGVRGIMHFGHPDQYLNSSS